LRNLNYDYEKDPILSYEISQIVEDELDPEKSIYRLLGYNELVPNEDFARLLNVRGEFCVGDTIYKVSPKGTYFSHYQCDHSLSIIMLNLKESYEKKLKRIHFVSQKISIDIILFL
jgi:hypothetical protein